MYGFFIVLHIIICVGLMIAVLMQSAKGEGLAGAFGGTSMTGTVFGGRGAAPFLAKATTGLAVAFFLSCIVLAFLSPAREQILSGAPGESAVQKAAQERATQAPPAQQQAPPGEVPGGQGAGSPADAQELELPPATGEGTDQQQAAPSGDQPAEEGEEEGSGGSGG